MKKYFKYALFFALYGLAAGVYFREFTKFNDFSGNTMLSMAHPHILMLGLGGFLLLALLFKVFGFKEDKKTMAAEISYMAGIVIASIMMIIRGSFEVLKYEISDELSGAISGIAGIGHVLVAFGIIMYLFIFIKKEKEN